MPNLPSSGQLSMGAIADNQSSASRSNLSLKTQSEAFASGSEVAGSPLQTTARANLIAAPYSISEFFNADFVSDVFSNISITTAGGGSDKNTVDGENLIIGFDANPDSGDFTVQLVDSSGNVDDTETRSGEGSVTFSSLALTDDTYTPRIRQGFASADGDTITHHDAIGTITITDPSDTTVANNSATTNIEHQISITNDTAFNDINWTFAKSSGDGSAPSNISNSSDRSPTVSYTGAGVFTIDCRVDGTPSQARNSSTAAQVTHRIDFAKAITINNPTSRNEGTGIAAIGTHQGFSSGIDVDLIQASDNSVLLSNDDTTDSRVTITNYNQNFTAPARTDSTLSVKVTAFDGSDSATSNAFNIYPLISQQFDANDLSFGASAVEVNQNVTLDVANDVTDNIVGYQWSNQGSGNMTVQSGNASAGDTDGSADDSVSIIDLTDQSHPTVRFDTVEQNKTIRLSLFGRTNQTATADKNIDVELADALSINAISNTNSPNAITVSGNHSGFENGVTVGLVTSASPNSFISGKSAEETTNPDSRFTQRSFSESFTPADQLTTQTLQGRVTADGESDSANTSDFSYFPELKADRNVINPTSMTIFSSTRNTDTSTFPTSQQFGSPTNRTDNITSRTYTEHADSGNAISLSGDTTPSSQTATQPTVNGGVATGTGTVRYTIEGNTGQSRTHDCAVTVNFSKEIFSVSTPAVAGNDTVNDNITFSFSNQGFNLLSTRFELIDASDDTTQIGNDSDSTSFTGGGLQATNTENVTLTSQASTFGNSTGGTYKIKISLFENDSQSGTPIKTALTNSFQTFSISEFTSTFKGVDTGEGTFIGYASKLLAAENNSSTEGTANRTISQAIGGAKLFALNLNQGSTVGRNNTLSTTFDGNEESGQNFFNNDGSVIEINGSDGVIDSVTDGTPATLNAVSEISDATDDVTIRITGDTTVIRVIHVVSSVNIGGASMASFTLSEGTGTTQQNSSFSVDKSLKTLFGASLASGTTFGITVRGVNEAESGSLSPSANVTTDAAATSVTAPSNFDLTMTEEDVFFTSPLKQFSISNPVGNTTVTFVRTSGKNFETHQFDATTTGTPSSFISSGNTRTLSSSTNVNVIVRFRTDDEVNDFDNGLYTITVTNNSASATCVVTAIFAGE